jgi:hypothetical protein
MEGVTKQKQMCTAVLCELHRLTDEALETSFTPEEEEKMKEVLHLHHMLKRVGLHASNTAATADMRAVGAHVQDKVCPYPRCIVHILTQSLSVFHTDGEKGHVLLCVLDGWALRQRHHAHLPPLGRCNHVLY